MPRLPRRSTRVPSARTRPLPDLRRPLLLGAALLTALGAWAATASAQDGPGALVEAVPLVASPAATPETTPPERAHAAPTPRHAPQPVTPLATDAAGPRLAPPLVASGRVDASRLGVSRVDALRPAVHGASSADRNDPTFRRNLALVVVGLASVAIGTAVDDAPGTVLILGGAGLSLYGLYKMLH
jgi:hypothetical protein